MRLFSFFALLCVATHLASAAGTLVSGPMLGYRAHRETVIVLETRDAREVRIDYQVEGRPETARSKTITAPWVSPAGGQPMKFVLPLLEMGSSYTYTLTIDGQLQTVPYPLAFKTTDLWEWRKAPPDFSFLFGSCAYLNDSAYDRPGTPYGKGTEIFRHMAESGADFTLWGGDNLYLREADYSSESGIWYRYSHDRATPDLQKLYAAMHHYATWDDHDYGPDNANQSFEFKDVTLAAFKTYWGNPTYGETDNPGVYGKFVWGDAAFFLMDDRTHRDDTTLDQEKNPRKTAWGDRQITWLKQSLLHAKALKNYRFKFIVTGGQVVQSSVKDRSETHELYRREREELIDFIQVNKITGVIFLTGDVHHTGLYRRPLGDNRSIYELTSSPFSSGSWNAATSEKARDPLVVPGTLVGTQNYCQLRLTGPKDARAVVIRCYDKSNAFQWEHTIPAADLEIAPPAKTSSAP
jgi:alkaline phosphatase D